MASNWNPSNSGAFGFPMHAVVLIHQPMTWDLPVLFEFAGHLASTFGSALACFSRVMSTPLCVCPVDTELVRGMNSPVQKSILQYSTLTWMVSRLFFFLRIPRHSGLTLEYQMSWILKIFYHLWRTKIPLATIIGCISLIPLAFFSGSQECPVSTIKFEAYSLIFLR